MKRIPSAFALLALPVAAWPAVASAQSSQDVDPSVQRYLSRKTGLTCDGLEEFDFLLESASVIGEWCRVQNNQLGEKGCGYDTTLCVKELFESDLPGGKLNVGVSVGATFGSTDSSGTSVTQSDYVWNGNRGSDTSTSNWGGSGSFNYVEVRLEVGVEIPLGSRRLRRVTCINPLDHEYVRMLATNTILQNQNMKAFSAACRVRPR